MEAQEKFRVTELTPSWHMLSTYTLRQYTSNNGKRREKVPPAERELKHDRWKDPQGKKIQPFGWWIPLVLIGDVEYSVEV